MWLDLRFLLGIAFPFHGYQKLSIPYFKVREWYKFSLALASFVPLAELCGGGLIIVSDYINGPLGNILKRWSASVIAVYIVITIFNSTLGLVYDDQVIYQWTNFYIWGSNIFST